MKIRWQIFCPCYIWPFRGLFITCSFPGFSKQGSRPLCPALLPCPSLTMNPCGSLTACSPALPRALPPLNYLFALLFQPSFLCQLLLSLSPWRIPGPGAQSLQDISTWEHYSYLSLSVSRAGVVMLPMWPSPTSLDVSLGRILPCCHTCCEWARMFHSFSLL